MRSKPFLLLFAVSLAVLTLLLPCTLFAGDVETILYSFTGDDGSLPYPALILDGNGNLYGTTIYGGSEGAGTVFELSPSKGKWTEKVLLSFDGGSGGANPDGPVVFDGKGNLYGTTFQGGAGGAGVVFELSPTKNGWTETVLHSFSGPDGADSEAAVVFDAKGNLYGTTTYGGTYGDGAVFELTPSNGKWTEKVLHSFNPSGTDALFPEAAVIVTSKGTLYGTTYGGGSNGAGAVFELSPGSGGSWTEKVLHSFNLNGTDGIQPEAPLVMDAKGNLYGTTPAGGNDDAGTIFRLTGNGKGAWNEKILYSAHPSGGSGLFAPLTFDASGDLYTSTVGGGAYTYGAVLELKPANGGAWTETLLHSFDPATGDGLQSTSGVVFDQNGNMYGTTEDGGTTGSGVVFEISPK
ncbi:MAG TPA: choice-of-anchor tandem repeat GloVer-containing protein [Terriglobales bacterium]